MYMRTPLCTFRVSFPCTFFILLLSVIYAELFSQLRTLQAIQSTIYLLFLCCNLTLLPLSVFFIPVRRNNGTASIQFNYSDIFFCAYLHTLAKLVENVTMFLVSRSFLTCMSFLYSSYCRQYIFQYFLEQKIG